VVAPPSATWHHHGYLHDTASPYAHNVHFQIYKIADTSRKLGPWRAHGVEFDVEKFKQQTQRLALPNQKFTYTTTELNMMDDEMLAVAFATSLKTTFLEVPHAVADPISECKQGAVVGVGGVAGGRGGGSQGHMNRLLASLTHGDGCCTQGCCPQEQEHGCGAAHT
jgi:hypothetical protein